MLFPVVSVSSIFLVAYHFFTLVLVLWPLLRTIRLWYVVVAFCCICLISVPCSILYFLLLCDWIQRCMTFLWYVNVALCCICLTNVLAYQFFCCCVTGHSLAWSSCGMWTFSPIASVWLNCQHIISFPILFDWTSSCTTLLWYVNVVLCCNYLISFFRSISIFCSFVTAYCLARFSCGMSMSPFVAAVWQVFLVAYRFYLSFCVWLATASHVFSCGMWMSFLVLSV